MRKLIFLTTFSVMLLGGSYATFAQGGGGEKPPEVAKPRPVPPRETAPTRPPVSVAPARPIRPALSAMVITTNVSDTTIALNGRKAGATNSNNALFIDSLKPGSYTVTLSKPGYRGLESTVRLRAGVTESLAFELIPILQTLTVHSIPGEAEVLIDEVSRGYTDESGVLRLTVPIGIHRVTVRKPRFRAVQQAVALTEQNEAKVAAELLLAVGILTVTTNVPDAMIEIAGDRQFKGAAEKIDCEPGTHQVTVTRPLFETANKQVSIAAGQSLNVSIDLEPDLGERGRLVSQAQRAFANGSYRSVIDSASQLLSVDPAHAQALKLVSQSLFMSNSFDSFSTYAIRAIAAGETIEIALRHHHSEWGLGTNMHPIKLIVRKETIGIDPQVTQGVICNLRQVTQDDLQNLKTIEVAGNGRNEIYLRLIFTDPANPKKTASFKFADHESQFIRQAKTAGGLITYEGQTMVSRPQALAAISALNRFISSAKMAAGTARATTLGSNAPELVLIPDAPVTSLESIIDSSIKGSGGPMSWSTIAQKGTYTWSLVKTGQTISGSFEEYVRTQQGFFHSFNHESSGFFLREGFDGTTAWFQLAREKPKQYEAVNVESLKRSMSLFSLQTVDDFRKAFPTATVRGLGKLGERRVYVVDAPRVVEGRVDTFYFDSENGLLLRQDTSYQDAKDRSKASITKVFFDSYTDVGGRKVVTGWKQIAPAVVITVRIFETKHDVPLDETKFKMPAK